MLRKHALLTIVVLLVASCGRREEKNIEPVSVLRYDQALMRLDTAHLKESLQELTDSFPLYLEGADWENRLNLLRIRNFIEDPVMQSTFAKIEQEYGDSKRLGTDLARIFHHSRRLFPDFKNPKVYTYLSYFDFVNRVMYFDSALSIALDLYVNGNEALLDEVGIPRYMSRKLNAAHLMPDLARVMGSSLIKQEKENLLDYIVHEGKVVYFMEQVLPETEMENIFGYTHEQVLWCKAHEKEVWQYVVQQNLLFETNPLKFRYFVNEGPFNPLLDGAPARLSQFIGLRIVHAYLDKSGTDFQSLLSAKPQEVLQVSAYRP